MSSKEDKDLSLVLCSTLDNLGYKKENVSLRSNSSEEKLQLIRSLVKRTTFALIPAGSSAEGVQLSDSDKDIIVVCEDAVCLDHGDVNRNFSVLETDYTNTAPGYTKLVSMDEIGNTPLSVVLHLSHMYSSIRSYSYISSTKFRQLIYKCSLAIWETLRYENLDVDSTTTGPAVTNKLKTEDSFSDFDNVYSIYFYGGEYLPRWANRTRYYQWPSQDVLKEISEMEGYVVPVGDKQSENQNLEWRICYTTAEKKLVSHLSGVQIKLYVLLKLLAKHILKPVCKALTSYVVKNVIFWITETTSPEEFSPDNLVQLVLKSLHFIKHCFENNLFPNYMIPERNLLRGAVCGQEKRAVIHFLSECLTEGRHMILRIPKLSQCMSLMVKTPESMVTYGRWRDEVERLIMLWHGQSLNNFDFKLLFSSRMVDETIKNHPSMDTFNRILALVIPEWFSMLPTGHSEEELLNLYCKRLKTIRYL